MPETILSHSLYLGKYREFHKLYEEGQFQEAAHLLISLLTSKLAPQRYYTFVSMNKLFKTLIFMDLRPLYFRKIYKVNFYNLKWKRAIMWAQLS